MITQRPAEGNDPMTATVASFTTPGTDYRVTLLPEGGAQCTCPDHIWRQRECKHIAALKAERDARAQRFEALLFIAREETTANLLRCLKKYEAAGEPLDVCVAIRVALFERGAGL